MKLLYFAWVRQKIGRTEEEISIPAGVATVADLIASLRARGPGYAEAFRDPARLRCAVNQEHVTSIRACAKRTKSPFFRPCTGG